MSALQWLADLFKPELRIARNKRRLEALLHEERVSRTAANRIVARYFRELPK